jgi:hypothetical protein
MTAAGVPEVARLVSADELASVDAWLRLVDSRAARIGDPGVGHVLVTPLGMAHRRSLRSALDAAGIAVLRSSHVPSWAPVSSAIYVRRARPGALHRAVLFERAWEALFPGAAAEAWAVDPASLALLSAVKHAVRATMSHIRIPLDGCARGAVLHPFHVADPCDRADEARRLLAAVACLRHLRRVRPGPPARVRRDVVVRSALPRPPGTCPPAR